MKTKIIINKNDVILKINKNIYPKEVLIQTGYILLDDFYFLIDEDDKYFIVFIKPKDKDKNPLKDVVNKFLEELLESASYIDQMKRTSKIRETILQKALMSNTQIDEDFIEELKKTNSKDKF